ncbi:MAG: extracellular solute-binding protein [Oscillospiraceae bacterium]
MLKRCRTAAMTAVLFLALVSCSGSSEVDKTEIITQTVIPKDKIPITVLVKYAFSINSFEKIAEKELPHVDIIQVGNYTSDMGIAEYETRLKHKDITDVVMTWPLDVGEQYWQDNLMDLSTLPLSGTYITAMLNNIARDGKLYYLPGPSQIRGIVYNKTLFKERGWKVPDSFDEFVRLCQDIESSGMRSLQLGLENSEVLDTAFVGFGFESSFSKPQDTQWIDDYNNGIGCFKDNFMPALETFQQLIDAGILKKDDLDIGYADREYMLFNRECAMIEDSVLLARMGFDLTGSTDEFALMPFFNPGTDSDWVRLYPVCYIGVNKNLAEPKNAQKLEAVMSMLKYISTLEGQRALSGDTEAVFSSLKGVSPPNIVEIEDMRHALNNGRYAVFPTFKNAQNALRRGLAGMVEGKFSAIDVAKMVDEENLSPSESESLEVFGTASEDFTQEETGSFVTDVMRDYSGCEMALFLDNGKDGRYNGKGISASLYEGELTRRDINRVLPDLKRKEKGELWKITMSGEDLIKTLEYSIDVDNNRGGWFYYFSGLKLKFNPSAQPGSRIIKITTDMDEEIEPDKLYHIAVMDESVPPEFIKSCEKTGVLIGDIMAQNISDAKTVKPRRDGRLILIQP